MITIPTSEFCGLLADVLPFACPDPEVPRINCVRVEWDGHQLHALSTDQFRIGWSRWEPGDLDEGGARQDDLFTSWGSADDPWSCCVQLDDAKELVSVFKLPPKEGVGVALTLDFHIDRGRLYVQRSRDTGYSAITVAVDPAIVEFPDVRKILAGKDALTPTVEVAYTAKYLADFAKVRPRGPLELRFAERMTLVTIGERFVGAVVPVTVNDG